MTITDNTSAPLVAVIGSTGKQGGSVIAALKASHKQYRVRGFTRDATKPAAQALANEGVEVVAVNASLENKEAVFKAFEGADIAFVVTAIWDHMSMEKEIEEGKMMLQAAVAGGAKTLVWSGLASIVKASKGEYTQVFPFDGKAEVTEWARAKFAGTAVAFVDVQAGWYGQNLNSPGPTSMVQPVGDGTYAFRVPGPASVRFPVLDVRDFGKWVQAAIEDPAYAGGGELLAASEYVAVPQIAEDLSTATGKRIVFKQVAPESVAEALAPLGVPQHMVDCLAYFPEAMDKVGYYGDHHQKQLTKISTPVKSWKEFVAEYDFSAVLK